jgi:LysM repeat protein
VAVLIVGLALLSSAMAGGVAARASGGSRPVASKTYVVSSGDTLWRLAARIVGPDGDPRPVVDRLIELNGIRDGIIVPGQRLAIP